MFKYLEKLLVLRAVLFIAAVVFFVSYEIGEKKAFNEILQSIETEMTAETGTISEIRQTIEDYIIKYPGRRENIRKLSDSFNEKLYSLHRKYSPQRDYLLLTANLSYYFFGDNFSFTREISAILAECSHCRDSGENIF